MITFSPPRPPVYSSAKTTELRVREAKFGDGYSQRIAAGLNVEGEEWTLQFVLLVSQADTVEAFMRARGGVEAFLWTPPREATAKRWVCAQWSRQPSLPGTDEMRLTFRRVYDLTT
jgi:phage-related protein